MFEKRTKPASFQTVGAKIPYKDPLFLGAWIPGEAPFANVEEFQMKPKKQQVDPKDFRRTASFKPCTGDSKHSIPSQSQAQSPHKSNKPKNQTRSPDGPALNLHVYPWLMRSGLTDLGIRGLHYSSPSRRDAACRHPRVLSAGTQSPPKPLKKGIYL